MDILGLPAPQTLYADIGTAIATTQAIANGIAKFGSRGADSGGNLRSPVFSGQYCSVRSGCVRVIGGRRCFVRGIRFGRLHRKSYGR